MQIRRVYLDNNATTKDDDEVIKYMNNLYLNNYAIASSQFSHTPGIKAKEAVENARSIIAQKINAKTDEVIFTSGATESNNLALEGVAFANINSDRKKIVISKIEHFSVLHSARTLEKFGFKEEYVNVDSEGFVNIEHLKSLIDDKTLLVSIIYANHEVGTVQDIKAISDIVHKYGAYLHTDAVVAFLQIPIDVVNYGTDLMSITAHKIYGPKGVGALFVKKGVNIEKIMDGGFNEFNLRAGTENVPGIAGFGKAVEVFPRDHLKRVGELRDYLCRGAEGKVNGKDVEVVSPGYLREKNISVSDERIEKLTAQGKTVVFVIINGEFAGVVTLGDIIRPESKKAISMLKEMGIRYDAHRRQQASCEMGF